MNVASAIVAAPSAPAFMTARNGQSVDEGAGSGIPPATEQERSVFQRFPVIAFSYEADASRLIMLYRDPESGKTIEQIPSEAALKQYKERQASDRRKELAELRLLVGGSGADAGDRLTSRAGKTVGEPTTPTNFGGNEGASVSPAVAAGGTGTGGAPQSGVNLLV